MHNLNFTIAYTRTIAAIEAGMKRYDLAENTPPRWQPIYCAAPGCDRRADIWTDERTALCGRCYLTAIGDKGDVTI